MLKLEMLPHLFASIDHHVLSVIMLESAFKIRRGAEAYPLVAVLRPFAPPEHELQRAAVQVLFDILLLVVEQLLNLSVQWAASVAARLWIHVHKQTF